MSSQVRNPHDLEMSIAGVAGQENISTQTAEVTKEDIVVMDATIPPQAQTPSNYIGCCKGRRYWAWMLFILSVGLIIVCFQLGLFEETKHTAEHDDYDRKEYYDELQKLFLPPINSPQAQAVEWLAFQDIPLEGTERPRIWQRFALCVLFFQHGGTLWNTPNGWVGKGVGIHECDWTGVDCSPNTEVTSLRFAAGGSISLTGTSLTTELGFLSSLSFLDVSDQRMAGTIPQEWQQLKNMTTLDLSNNAIRGTIPSFLATFSSLRTLALGGNHFTGKFPANLLGSNTLEYLDLQDNLGIQANVSQIMTSMPNLLYLDVGDRMISGSLPAQSISNIKILRTVGATLTGSLPFEIGTWTNLEKLVMGNSELFEGTLPSTLALLSNLDTLRVEYQESMSGTLPTELGLLQNLTELQLKSTSREGTLPTEYGQLNNLIRMDLSFNEISGTIPSEYANLSSLKTLLLHHTDLTGIVGQEVCRLDFIDFWADCERSTVFSCDCCTQCQWNP